MWEHSRFVQSGADGFEGFVGFSNQLLDVVRHIIHLIAVLIEPVILATQRQSGNGRHLAEDVAAVEDAGQEVVWLQRWTWLSVGEGRWLLLNMSIHDVRKSVGAVGGGIGRSHGDDGCL